ncbi:SIMPL domain-containing protein [Rhodoferax bucti]|uniref:SIMPL domain-containing protein n=1 Tax=Rhodoferax bucti TaxID=2576305 RepID=UPI0014777D87|nr:SIMPL domain-containing protein [Rhodoferax bucti]
MQQTAEINVTGRGTVSASPDGIQIDLSVISENIDYSECLSVLNTCVAKIIDGVERAGTNESVFTKSYAITEVWTDQYDRQKRKFQGYSATQKLIVTIPLNTKLLGSIVQELAKSDSNADMEISFVIRDMEPLKREARIAAAAKAKESATDFAVATGLQLSSVKTITYSAGKNASNSTLHIDSLSQYSVSSFDTVTPDEISHDEIVNIVWLAT